MLFRSKYFSDVFSACNYFSRTVRCSTIRAMCRKRNALSRAITNCLVNLSNVCPPLLVTSIRRHIHHLNSSLYQHIKMMKVRNLNILLIMSRSSLKFIILIKLMLIMSIKLMETLFIMLK